jgi:hypothetical protein
VLALVVLDRVDHRREASSTRRGLTGAVAALAVVAALVSGVQVYRVGDSGARSAWGDRVGSTGAGQ